MGAAARTAALAVICASLIVGCGSGHKHKAPMGAASSSGRIPAADRDALLEIGETSATLRLETAGAALGRRGRVDTAAIVAAGRRLALARPADRELARLKTQLAAACSQAATRLDGHGDVRGAARGAVAATDAVNAGLRHYAARHPAVAGVIPD